MSQDVFGEIGFFEDFNAPQDDGGLTVVDANSYQLNDILIIANSGDVNATPLYTASGGQYVFSGAGGAGDGFALLGAPMKPSVNGVIAVGGRFKIGTVTTAQLFLGWAQTVDKDEVVLPFTLSAVTLTANNAGSCVGFYYDTTATTKDMRFMASLAGVAQTSGVVKDHGGAPTTLGTLGIRANYTMTADSFVCWRVELDPSGTVRGYLGDISTDPDGSGMVLVATLKAGVITASAAHHPVAMCIDPGTTDPDWTWDFFYGRGSRDWTV